MARRNPDERWRVVLKATEEPAHPIEALCWKHLHNVEFSAHFDRAHEIYKTQYERERLQPWILAGADDLDINDRVGLSVDTVRIYRHTFFNSAVFRDLLDKQFWVETYEGTDYGRSLLSTAILSGLEAVAHAAGTACKLDPAAVLEASMREMFFRAQAIRSANLTSPTMAVTHALLKTAVEQAQLMAKTRPATIGDVILKLKNRDMTQRMEEIELHGEILH